MITFQDRKRFRYAEKDARYAESDMYINSHRNI